ncbi:MAG: tetratricopeptide repeat protein [Limisphaerales bacterium]
MDKRLDFRFQIPKPPDGPLIELTPDETEKFLIQKVDEAGEDPKKALWQLAQFYKLNKQHEKALERLRQLIALLPDPESKASCVFTMGQAMEQVGDYAAAVRYYKEAFALEPASTFTWYTRTLAFGALANGAGTIESARLVLDRAKDALNLPDTRYPKERLLGLIAQLLHRWPELRGVKEQSVIYERKAA